jgi:hypothetical protein
MTIKPVPFICGQSVAIFIFKFGVLKDVTWMLRFPPTLSITQICELSWSPFFPLGGAALAAVD